MRAVNRATSSAWIVASAALVVTASWAGPQQSGAAGAPPAVVWESEAFASRASEQLAALARLCSQPKALGVESAQPLFDANFACGPLRPAKLGEVARGGITVRRAAADQPVPQALRGPEGAVAALRAMLEPFDKAREVALEFEITSVELDGSDASTIVRLRTTGGPLQQNATWQVRWIASKEASAPAPKIAAIEARDFSECAAPAGAAVLFTQCTDAVFGASDAYAKQLAPSLESWCATLDAQLGISFFDDGGIALADVDGDGLDDLFVAQPGGLPNRLFLHKPDGTLSDITRDSGLDYLDATRSALFVDFDNDGDEDVALALATAVVFLRNDGKGRFERAFDAPVQNTNSMAAADFDGDGNLDLYACASTDPFAGGAAPLPYHDANTGWPNTLLRNASRGDAWKFDDATVEVGLDENNRRYGRACAWEDVNGGGGDLDLFVANDFGRCSLYSNKDGHFRDVAATTSHDEVGLDLPGSATGLAWGDFDRDGDSDLIVSGVFSGTGQRIAAQPKFLQDVQAATRADFRRLALGNRIYLNDGAGSFTLASSNDIADGGWARGAITTDFDNDGIVDLFVPNGFVSGEDPADLSSFLWREVVANSPTVFAKGDLDAYDRGWRALQISLRQGKSLAGRERDRAFLGAEPGRFADISSLSGLDSSDDSLGAACVDWDFDGRSDLVVVGRNSPRVRFHRNQTQNANSFLELTLRGTRCNRDAIGANVIVSVADQPPQTLVVRAGDGSLSQSSKRLRFGLGSATAVKEVWVFWPRSPDSSTDPKSRMERFPIDAVNGFYVLTQGTGKPERWTPPQAKVALASSTPAPIPVPAKARIVLAARVPLPTLAFATTDGAQAEVAKNVEAPVLVEFWSADNETCVAQLRELAAREADVKASGLSVLALGVDGETKRAAALDLLTRLQWDFHVGFATPELFATLDVLQGSLLERERPMKAPVGFLIDGSHELAAIYKGPIAVDTLLADVARLRAKPGEVRDGAVPFPGRWFAAPRPADLDRVVNALHEHGLEAAAAEVEHQRSDRRKTSQAQILYEFGVKKAEQERLDDAIVNFRQAVELDPAFGEALSALAFALHRSGKLAEAIPVYERALRADPRDATVLHNLALAHFAAGQADKARQDAQTLQALDPATAAQLFAEIARLREQAKNR